MRLTNEDYVAKISNASPLQLVVINFELLLQNIDEALEYFEKGSIEAYREKLQKAQSFLMLLMKSLDMDIEISKELMELYIFANGLLIKAGISKKTIHAKDAYEILNKLGDSFRAILQSGTEASAPVMENAQQLYAGLTYSRGGVLSEYVKEDKGRGYKA